MFGEHREMVEKYKDKPFALIGMNVDELEADDLAKQLKEKNVTWRNANLGSSAHKVLEAYNVQGFPTLVIIDKKGNVVDTDAFGKDVDKIVDGLLADPG